MGDVTDIPAVCERRGNKRRDRRIIVGHDDLRRFLG
jgi:hypothetical protein